ncbi:TPA: 6,7-dimethyl-8-ribityllumazine synthase [Candidatus Woesearchaeota archaeon]|nr:6,7-dimethyl-8-ribityllumazine synthase [archaeon]HIJ11017.1 6,7-dimethyl-8-ribityllumazine synthase [Candidatus Woesearchaeota archaeon]|tara:strand:+ start:418 stop:810 length:393 start_codon:yes stop_codon:yes gene_type:complete
MKIGIVVSKWYYEEITEKMLMVAQQAAKEANVEVEVCEVPGSFEVPYGVKKIIENVDGVVTLGAIVKGSTDHDQIIAYTVASKITDLSLQYGKPVVLGVNGPGMSKAQAIERIPRAGHVMESCIEMVKNG